MERPLYDLLEKKFSLHAKKYELINKLKQKNSLFDLYKNVYSLKILLLKELSINQRALRRLSMMERRTGKLGIEALFDQLEYLMRSLVATLKEEHATINEISFFDILSHKTLLVFDTDYQTLLLRKVKRFQQLYEEETKQNQRFIEFEEKSSREIEKTLKEFKAEKEKLFAEKKLVKEAQRKYARLLRAIGNKKKFEVRAREFLKVTDKLKKTLIYEFVNEDVDKIEKKVRYIMAHPNESRIAYFLTGVYIIAPGTFEATFVILVLRYLTKYTLAKTKKLREVGP